MARADQAPPASPARGLEPRLLPELPQAWLSLEVDDNHPAQFHLSLTGALQQLHPGFGEGARHDPPLPLARMAARRLMAEIRRPDLRFSASEAHRLLNQVLGLALSPGDLAALESKAEGWPAGLWLLANSLGRIDTGNGRAAFLLDMAATDRYVFDFLADEVVRSLEPELRTFLLQTSVLADLTPSACQAVP